MIEILPVQESDGVHALEACERGQAVGRVELTLREGEAALCSLSGGEDALLDALLRAAFSYALSHGADRAVLESSCAPAGVRLGLVSGTGEHAFRVPSLLDFLTNSKKCKNW